MDDAKIVQRQRGKARDNNGRQKKLREPHGDPWEVGLGDRLSGQPVLGIGQLIVGAFARTVKTWALPLQRMLLVR